MNTSRPREASKPLIKGTRDLIRVAIRQLKIEIVPPIPTMYGVFLGRPAVTTMLLERAVREFLKILLTGVDLSIRDW
jgi:hypothetical protein